MTRVSVVTVVFNDRENLGPTIRSVVSQTHTNVEFILIDGGSTDGTLELLSEYADSIDILVSEPDEGIYDAMNKGIRLATGDWIHFLNAGDSFWSEDTLERLFSRNREEQLFYGRHEADYGFFRRIHEPAPLHRLRFGMVFSHQAMFVRTDLMKTGEFDTRYSICADYNFIYRLFKDGLAFEADREIVATLKAGGVSEVNSLQTHIERWGISRGYERSAGKLSLDFVFFVTLVRKSLIQGLKKVLPERWVRRLTRMKYAPGTTGGGGGVTSDLKP